MTIKKIPLGQKIYFQMDTLERKNYYSTGYPKGSLAIEIYDAIAEWCPRCSRAVDSGTCRLIAHLYHQQMVSNSLLMLL
jgi:hypothetical protein